jgi:2,5-diketo-D-gluconate reductase B
MPKLGFGTFELEGRTCRRAVRCALETGYRHIDTAAIYKNEEEVGKAVRESGVAREELFLTTKVWWEDLSPAAVRRSLERSLRLLKTGYVDLFLIHWPNPEYPLEGTLEAMLDVHGEGKARFLGVSNFPLRLMERARQTAPIFCNQVEYHPRLGQQKLLDALRSRMMALVAYTPLGRGRDLENERVRSIASRHDRHPAQVILRWLLQQQEVAAIPRSSKPEHIRSNFDVLDFELGTDEMDAVFAMDEGERLIDPGWAPDWEA